MGTTFVNDCWTWSYGGGTWRSGRLLRPAVTPSSTYFEIEFEVELELTTPLAVTEEMSESLVPASLGRSRLASAGPCKSTN